MNEYLIHTRAQLSSAMTKIAALDWSRPQVITVKPYRESRSLSINALFHVWVRELAEEFTRRGRKTSEEEMKDILKAEFLGFELRRIPSLSEKGMGVRILSTL